MTNIKEILEYLKNDTKWDELILERSTVLRKTLQKQEVAILLNYINDLEQGN